MEGFPASIVERVNVHRLSASVDGRASRFCDSGRMARSCGVNTVSIQGCLKENGGRHYCLWLSGL
jgi:hypothetical protein